MKTFDSGLLLVSLLVLLAASPLFPPGLPSIADAPIHLFRTMEMVSCWADGIYYPRWAPHLAFGYGYPLFDFAPPLPYFVAGALHTVGFSLETSIKLLAMFCLAVYGLGMYLFTRNVLGGRAALLAAAAYIYTPFRFWEILLYGGNYPQILAIGLFPWVLWTFERIIADGRQRYVIAGVICYAALILSHNFHAFIFTPVLVLYIVAQMFFLRSPRLFTRESKILNIPWALGPVLAMLMGLVLTAFFWAPALHDRQYTAAQEEYYLTRSDFRPRLLSLNDLLALPVPLDGRADNPYVPFSLGAAVVVLAALGVAYLLLASLRLSSLASYRARQVREILHLAFFLLVLLGASFMMLRPAAFLWERLPFLPYAEFPWRLMGIANLGAAFLVGGSVRLWERDVEPQQGRSRLADFMLITLLLCLILGVAVYFYPTRAFLHWGTPELSDYVDYELHTQNLGTTGLAEYLPRWVEEIPTSSPLVSLLREGKTIEKLDRSDLPDNVKATAMAHTATTDRYRFRSEIRFRATFLTFYFPGWRAFLDGKPVPIQITAPLGLVAVDVPPGEHELLLRFGETPFQLAMDVVSVMGLLGLISWLVSRARRRGGWKGSAPGVGVNQAGLTGGQAWPLGMLVMALFIGKISFVDSHTTWFRRDSPPGQVIGAQQPMHIQLEDNVLFLGYDLIGKEVMKAGELLQVRLYWQASGPLRGDYISFVHLDAPPDNVTFATADNYHPGDPQAQNDVPSLQWNPALYVRDEHRLALPNDILPIAYSLRVGLYERRTGRRLRILSGEAEGQQGDTIYLQEVHILPARPPRPGAMQSREKYRLGESIELLGHSVKMGEWADGRIQAGQTITVTLYWQALTPVKDYTVFVHLLDGAGQLQGQDDGPPLNGRYPTHSWLPHQIVEDESALVLAPDLSPGEYRIAVGMYESATGKRLTVRDKGINVVNNAILLDPVLKLGEHREP